MYCLQGVFCPQEQQRAHSSSTLCYEIVSDTLPERAANNTTERRAIQGINVSCQTSEICEPISDNLTKSCSKQNEVVFTGDNKQVIKIQVSVNATIHKDKDESQVQSKSGKVPIDRASTSKRNCRKSSCSSITKRKNNCEYQQPKVELDTETDKSTFLSSLGLLSMDAVTARQSTTLAKETLLNRFVDLRSSRKRNVRNKEEPFRCCFDKKARKHKEQTLDTQIFKKRLPIVRLIRMEECKTLRKKYFMQMHRMLNIA